MPIIRKARFRPGSIDPSLVKPNTGLSVQEDTGELSGEALVLEDTALHGRIDQLYWKDPIQSLANIEATDPDDYRIGEAFFSIHENNIYIYAGNTPLASTSRSTYQPQSWVAANRTERFLVISAGVDADTWATKAYVDTELTNLIGGAPTTLNTLQELVNAINNDPNFGATILADLAGLQQNKADKSEIYTQAEIDQLEIDIIAAIAQSTSRFSNVIDYVCGVDPDDDDDDFSSLWQDTKGSVSFSTPKNYLIKQNVVSPLSPPIEIDKGNVHILGFHPPEKEHQYSKLNNVILRITAPQQGEPTPVLSFTNLSFGRLFVESDSAECILVFNNCLFDQLENVNSFFESQKSGLKIYINNCRFYSQDQSIQFSDCELKINRSTFNRADSNNILSFSNTINSYINNSKIHGSVNLNFTTELSVEKTYFSITEDASFINVSQDATLLLQRATFDTPSTYTAYYINGTGTAYFDYNIVDISLNPTPQPETRVKQPTAAPSLNDNHGADIYHFFDPLGSENFFYNDEKARDAISAMILAGTHSSPVSFTYDDASNTFSLTLSLATTDLTDNNRIAYLDVANVFTQDNTFENITTKQIDATVITATTLTATNSVTSPLITTTTFPQTQDDTTVATTEYVRTAITDLTASLFTTELDELSDVTITSPVLGNVIAYNPTGATTSKWTNQMLSSTLLSDSTDLIRTGDSVFKLSRIQPPAFPQQTGTGGYTGGYTAQNQLLAWNGEYVTNPSGTEGPGAYEPVLSNEIVLYATKRVYSQTYDGAGKIWLAEDAEVLNGTDLPNAVTPKQLYDFYTRSDGSNITDTQSFRDNLDIDSEFVLLDATNITDPGPLRLKLGIPNPGSEGEILEVDSTNASFTFVKRVLSYYKDEYVDFYEHATNSNIHVDNSSFGEKFYFADQEGTYFYNVKTIVNETNYLILPTLNGGYDSLSNFSQFSLLAAKTRIGPIVVRKTSGSTHLNAGTLSLMCGSNQDRILTADNVIAYSSNTQYGQAQIDLLEIGHQVVLWPIEQEGALYWYAEGYYYNSANQQQPQPTVVPTPEAIQDAIENFFNHSYHSPSIAIAYDDPNHRLVATQYFATQAQVNQGVVTNLPVAPNTLKTYVDAQNATNSATYLAKSLNLSDLNDSALARTNLELGTAALADIGTSTGQILTNGEEIDAGFLLYDPNIPGVKSIGLPVASTLNDGVIEVATLREITHRENTSAGGWPLAVTVDYLHEALETDNPYTEAIKTLTNSVFYTSTDLTTINAVVNHYYSLSTNNGSINVYLPEITNQSHGSQITIKYRVQATDTQTITIAPYQSQTIDRVFQPYILNVEGQSITLILGVDGWEIN